MSRQKASEPKTFNYDLSPFMPQNMTRSISFQHDSIETLREKLQIKSEALNLLAKQIELCNKEKSEHKRLVDTLYDKNLSLKKSLYFKENEVIEDNFESHSSVPHSATFNSALNHEQQRNPKNNNSKLLAIPVFNKFSPNSSSTNLFSDTESEDYMKILKDLVKTLQKEKLDLKQKYEDCEQQLNDSRSDLRLLREQIVRQRIGSVNEGLTYISSDSVNSSGLLSPVSTPQSAANSSDRREYLIKEIEQLKEQKNQIESQLNLVQCQKEETEIERDSFKVKYNKLNEFLSNSSTRIKSDSQINPNSEQDYVFFDQNKRLLINKSLLSLSIDELLSQNKYLNESNRNLKQEVDNLKKSLASKKSSANNNSRVELNLIMNDSTAVNKKYVEHVLNKAENYLKENANVVSSHSQTSPHIYELVHELKSLIEDLFENLNDKLIANVHQRKVNKMLAIRIQELEKELTKYFTIEKRAHAEQHVLLIPSEVDTSLNASLEHRLPPPLVPEISKQSGTQMN